MTIPDITAYIKVHTEAERRSTILFPNNSVTAIFSKISLVLSLSFENR